MICCEQCRVNEAVYMDPAAALWCRRCYARLPHDMGADFVMIHFLIQSLWSLPAPVLQETPPAAWVRASPHLVPLVERLVQLYPGRCPPGGQL